MKNPWEEISLSDYEEHMKLGSVMQLQTLNRIMKGQLDDYPVKSAMILGVAGGNGLEHIDVNKFEKVYGVDINEEYLNAVGERYSELSGVLECLRCDLTREADRLPRAELLIANLLIEYIGYERFKEAVRRVQPKVVSCVIQVNTGEEWVSDSPYIHAFDGLDRVHFRISENGLTEVLCGFGYKPVKRSESPLPNGKKLVRRDFAAGGSS
ncbi:MAG: methyltransferase type 11 [Oscillospiraceae bacterium]|nr:methyltransferase type 11 [Oscillospiraceae bacterium]